MNLTPLLTALRTYRTIWGGCALVVVLNLLLYVSFTRSQLQQVDALQTAYSARRQAVAQANRDTGRRQQFDRINESIEKFREYLPTKTMLPDQVAALENTLAGRRLEFERVSLKAEPLTAQRLWRYVTTLKLKGDYPEMKTVLAGIRQLPGLFCIERLVMEKKDPGGLEMTMVLALYLKEP
jgi:Tfp pilus assembly protein PilO